MSEGFRLLPGRRCHAVTDEGLFYYFSYKYKFAINKNTVHKKFIKIYSTFLVLLSLNCTQKIPCKHLPTGVKFEFKLGFKLLKCNFSANFFKFSFHSFSVFFRNSFFKNLRSAVYSFLSFFKTKTCDFSNDLDNFDLFRTNFC